MSRLSIILYSLLIISPVALLAAWLTIQLMRVRRVYRLRKDLMCFFLEATGNEQAKRCVWATSQPSFQRLEKGWGNPDAKISGEYADEFRAWRRKRVRANPLH